MGRSVRAECPNAMGWPCFGGEGETKGFPLFLFVCLSAPEGSSTGGFHSRGPASLRLCHFFTGPLGGANRSPQRAFSLLLGEGRGRGSSLPAGFVARLALLLPILGASRLCRPQGALVDLGFRATHGQPLPCVASPSRVAPTQPCAWGRLGRGRCAGWEMEAFF